MLRARIFLVLGVWIAILPYLGFPYSWKSVLYTLTGLAIIYLSYAMYQDYKKDHAAEEFDNFRENTANTALGNKKTRATAAIITEESSSD